MVLQIIQLDFYTDLLNDVDVILMRRKTYQLMESFWPIAYEDPRSTKSMIKVADKINPMNKIVFSNTLTEVNWKNSQLAKGSLQKIVSDFEKSKW